MLNNIESFIQEIYILCFKNIFFGYLWKNIQFLTTIYNYFILYGTIFLENDLGRLWDTSNNKMVK